MLEEYKTQLDEADKKIIDNRVAEKGIENYLSQQLIYLDCSRVINNMRMMQTIGYPYQREVTSYLYALNKAVWLDGYQDVHKKEWEEKLLKLHNTNLEYEKDNPPVWYGGKKAKDKWLRDNNKLPRKRKVREQTIDGMGREISNAERLKRLSAEFGNLTFKIKSPKR